MYPSNNGPLNDHNHVFLAQELTTIEKRLEHGEAIRPPKAFPREEVYAMVRSGKLTDGQSLGVLLYYKLWCEEQEHVL
jgi:hypothetical protein